MFWEMLRIRWYDLTGKYDAGAAVAQAVKTLPGGPAIQSLIQADLRFVGMRSQFLLAASTT